MSDESATAELQAHQDCATCGKHDPECWCKDASGRVVAFAYQICQGHDQPATAATEPHEFVKTWLDTCATCGQGIESADFALHGWDDDDDE